MRYNQRAANHLIKIAEPTPQLNAGCPLWTSCQRHVPAVICAYVLINDPDVPCIHLRKRVSPILTRLPCTLLQPHRIHE